MKFWELMSIMGFQRDVVGEVAESQDEWRAYRQLVDDFDALVDLQRRDILDALVPDDFAAAVLAHSDRPLFLGENGRLRSYRVAPADRELTVAEAAAAYGGTAVEEAFEYGSFHVNAANTDAGRP